MRLIFKPGFLYGVLLYTGLVIGHQTCAQVYTVADGIWTDGSIWSSGTPPGSASGGTDVTIRHAVTVDNVTFNATIRSLTIENGTNSVAATLRFNGGASTRTLHILNDLVLEGTTTNSCRVHLEGANTNAGIDGDIRVTRNHTGSVTTFGIRLQSGSSMTARHLILNYINSDDDAEEIQVEGTSSLVLSGDASITNSGGGEEASIDIVNSARFECNNLAATLSGTESAAGAGRDIELRMLNNAQVTIHGNLTLNRTGGRRIALNIGSTSTANVRVMIAGNMTVNHSNGLNETNKDLPVTVRGQSSISILGNLNASSTSARALTFTFNENSMLDVDGNVTLTGSANTNLTWRANNTARLFFGGDIQMTYPASPNPSAFTFSSTSPNISTVTFDGIANQTVPAETYGNLVIDNPTQVTLTGNIIVKNVLNLARGKMLAAGRTVTLDVAGSTLTGSSAAYICNGTLIRALNSGPGAHWFYVGSVEKGYSAVSLTDLSSPSTFAITYSPISPGSASAPGPYNPDLKDDVAVAVVSHGEFWNINRALGSGSANIKLGWNAASDVNGMALDQLRIAHWNGAQWNSMGNCDFTGDEDSGELKTQVPVSNFGPFTLASVSSDNRLLPVTILKFSAQPENEKVILTWKTSSEIDNDYFIIERSKDGLQFEAIGTIDGHGTTHEPIDYKYTDATPLPCRSYYRLKQVDYDGESESFNIVSVKRDPSDEIELYPNPVSHTSSEPINITLPECNSEGHILLIVYDAVGNVKWNAILEPGSQRLRLYPQELALDPGMYSINVAYPFKSFIAKIVVH
jgi:hypothetical protein